MLLWRIGLRAIALGGLATLMLTALGAAASVAADYQDEHDNVCEGNKPFEEAKGCPQWGGHLNSFAFNNVALGSNAMPAVTAGANNVAVGNGALGALTEGLDNVAVGEDALFHTTTGQSNLALGTQSLEANTSGQRNVAVGLHRRRLRGPDEQQRLRQRCVW
jgi:hypothetical protein